MSASTLERGKYSFSASAKTITFYLIDLDIRKIVSIVNKTRNQIIYAPAIGAGYGGSMSGSVLTLDYNTAAYADTDVLEIVYDWEAWYHKSHEMDFTSVVASGVDSAQADLLAAGSGMTVAQAAGALTIAMGTTVNAETIIRSKIPFTREILAGFASKRSSAIANNTCMVMLADKVGDDLAAVASSATALAVTIPASNPIYDALAAILTTSATGLVGQKMFIGGKATIIGPSGQYAIASATLNAGESVVLNFTVAGWTIGSGTVCLFGWNAIYYFETPATATTGSFDCVRNGWPSAVGEASVTVNSSTTGHGIAFYKLADNVVLADTALTSLAIPTDRAGRIDGIPTEETRLYLYIVARNGGTAPASSTTWTIGGVRIEESNAQPAIMTGLRIRNGGQSSMPVYFPATPTVTVGTLPATPAGANAIGDVGGMARATAGGIASNSRLLSAAASTNATSVKATAGRCYKIRGQNVSASVRWLKIYNKASAPTVGTDTPVYTFVLAASSVIDIDFGLLGLYFSTGIAYALTTGSADNDTGALTAGDILGLNVMYA